jgi:integrase
MATAAGSKRWHVKYREGGKSNTKALGRYPAVKLAEARALASEFRASLKNPKAEPAKSMTFAELAKDWARKFDPAVTENTAKTRRYIINKHILPALGALPAVDLKPALILEKVINPIAATGVKSTAHKVKGYIGLILQYGVSIGKLEYNPVPSLKGALAPYKPTHHAAITFPPAVGKLICDIRGCGNSLSVRYALAILPYVFVRSVELRGAIWEEFDFEAGLWRIPAGRMKMASSHIVPLSRQVLGLLGELKALGLDGKWLFPSPKKPDQPITKFTLQTALYGLGYAPSEMTVHGFRAMASTLLNEQGVKSDLIEKQLAHSERNGVRASYNRADYLEERRAMMQAWADYLDGLAAKHLAGLPEPPIGQI